jgi:hypothetical protein
LKNGRDHLRVITPEDEARTVPARRFSEVVTQKNNEKKLRIETSAKLALAVNGQARLLAVLDRLARNLPQDTRERLNGIGIGAAAEMTDVQLGGLLVRIDVIMGETGG